MEYIKEVLKRMRWKKMTVKKVTFLLLIFAVSFSLIFSMIGTIISGNLADRFGRKKILILGTSITLVGWLIIYFANNVHMLLLSRMVHGFGYGLVIPCAYLLVGEIALIKYRGFLGVLNTLTINLAFMVCLALAAMIPFNVNQLINYYNLIKQLIN